MRPKVPYFLAAAPVIMLPLPARASQVSLGNFEAVFNGVATLGLLVSALLIYFGYRLMTRELERAKAMPGSDVKLGLKAFNVEISKAAPGVIFAALGCIGMIASLWHFAK